MKRFKISAVLDKARLLQDGNAYVAACRAAAESWDEWLGYCLMTEDKAAAIRAQFPCDAYYRRKAGLATAGPCEHRGDVLRSEPCKSCCGNVQVKVYECAVHGECQMGSRLVGVRSCAGCLDSGPVSGGHG